MQSDSGSLQSISARYVARSDGCHWRGYLSRTAIRLVRNGVGDSADVAPHHNVTIAGQDDYFCATTVLRYMDHISEEKWCEAVRSEILVSRDRDTLKK
jgi:hypothetical protein